MVLTRPLPIPTPDSGPTPSPVPLLRPYTPLPDLLFIYYCLFDLRPLPATMRPLPLLASVCFRTLWPSARVHFHSLLPYIYILYDTLLYFSSNIDLIPTLSPVPLTRQPK